MHEQQREHPSQSDYESFKWSKNHKKILQHEQQNYWILIKWKEKKNENIKTQE